MKQSPIEANTLPSCMRLPLAVAAIWIIFAAAFLGAAPVMTAVACATAGSAAGVAEAAAVMLHGLPHTLAAAGYLSAPAWLLCLAMLVAAAIAGEGRAVRGVRVALEVWLGVASLCASLAVTLNCALYPYWRFPLDLTPLYYFATSPGAAMASLTWWQAVAAVVIVSALAVALWWALRLCLRWILGPAPRTLGARMSALGMMLLEGALIFLGIRGGVSVATLTPGAVYFSPRSELNHAAVNPLFNVVYAAAHSRDYASLAPYFAPEEATRIVSETRDALIPDTLSQPLLNLRTERPDIYLIILESFSASLFPHLGGEPVATGLDSIARSGVTFTRFYANGFRTDRGLTAILSALPSPPATAAIRHNALLERSPSLASALAAHGYLTRYYYGGDADFTNMRGYLVTAGFGSIVSDEDFPVNMRLSKWGVHDGPLFEKALSESRQLQAPAFTVIQTSSSHEPFQVPGVPRHARHAPAPVQAFAYTDSVVTAFIDALMEGPRRDSTLVMVVADHWGAWPRGLDDDSRHRIPFILTGGAMEGAPVRVERIASQADIAPMLLEALSLDPSPFIYGRSRGGGAFWFDAERAALVTDCGSAVLEVATDCAAPESTTASPADTAAMLRSVRAHIQSLYRQITGK